MKDHIGQMLDDKIAELEVLLGVAERKREELLAEAESQSVILKSLASEMRTLREMKERLGSDTTPYRSALPDGTQVIGPRPAPDLRTFAEDRTAEHWIPPKGWEAISLPKATHDLEKGATPWRILERLVDIGPMTIAHITHAEKGSPGKSVRSESSRLYSYGFVARQFGKGDTRLYMATPLGERYIAERRGDKRKPS